jgi:hypothetical protein
MFQRSHNSGFRLANVWTRLRYPSWLFKIWFERMLSQVARGGGRASVVKKPTNVPAGKKNGKDSYKNRGSKTETKKEEFRLHWL